MTQVVRNFLHAQKVQPLVELFVDWLAVGHVDEFLSFVPAPDGKVRPLDKPWPLGLGAGRHVRP